VGITMLVAVGGAQGAASTPSTQLADSSSQTAAALSFGNSGVDALLAGLAGDISSPKGILVKAEKSLLTAGVKWITTTLSSVVTAGTLISDVGLPILGSFLNGLIGLIFPGSNGLTINQIWTQLEPKIKQLINQEIAANNIQELKDNLQTTGNDLSYTVKLSDCDPTKVTNLLIAEADFAHAQTTMTTYSKDNSLYAAALALLPSTALLDMTVWAEIVELTAWQGDQSPADNAQSCRTYLAEWQDRLNNWLPVADTVTTAYTTKYCLTGNGDTVEKSAQPSGMLATCSQSVLACQQNKCTAQAYGCCQCSLNGWISDSLCNDAGTCLPPCDNLWAAGPGYTCVGTRCYQGCGTILRAYCMETIKTWNLPPIPGGPNQTLAEQMDEALTQPLNKWGSVISTLQHYDYCSAAAARGTPGIRERMGIIPFIHSQLRSAPCADGNWSACDNKFSPCATLAPTPHPTPPPTRSPTARPTTHVPTSAAPTRTPTASLSSAVETLQSEMSTMQSDLSKIQTEFSKLSQKGDGS